MMKRPCRICRRWFLPNPRLKDRQMTCADPKCKREWHRRKCAEWNKNNPDYFNSTLVPVRSRLKSGLPLHYVQEVIGIQHLVIIEYLAQLLLWRFQEVCKRQLTANTAKTSQLPGMVSSRCDRL